MKPLQIEFHAPPTDFRLATGLLASGAAMLLATVWLGSHIEPVRPVPAKPRPAAKSLSAVELAAVGQARSRIAMAWDRVFGVVEGASSPDVALLEFAPDGGRGELKIVAEARNLAAMLAYQKRLSNSPMLSSVTVNSHEVVQDSPYKPVRFTLHARWSAP